MTSPWYNPTFLSRNTRALAESLNAEFEKIRTAFDQLPAPGSVGTGTSVVYTHFAYADSMDGTVNFTTGSPAARAFIGIQPNSATPTPSPFPVDYQWSRIGAPQQDDLVPELNAVQMEAAQALLDAATAISNAATAQATADGKVTTFFQDNPPLAEGIGDLWIDTNDGNQLYRWNGTAWSLVRDAGIGEAITDAATAQATADGKIVTFYQASAPTAVAVGDLWIDTDDANKLYRWSGSAWVAARDVGNALGNVNRMPFSRFEGGRGWIATGSFSPTVEAIPFEGLIFIGANWTNTAADQNVFLLNNAFPVSPGERLSVSTQVEGFATAGGPNPNFWQIYFEYLDGLGTLVPGNTLIAQGVGPVYGDVRHAAFSNVPATARFARLVFRSESAGAGAMKSTILQPMVANASADQVVHPPYSPGPNAVDGALPNDLITVDGGGLLQGIGTGAGTPVSNIGVVLSGVLAARPASGAFLGQTYVSTDTREFFRWNGSAWVTASDVTATAQRSIEPQFPSIEIKQGEAGHTGNRTVTQSALRGTTALTGGTWTLPAENLGAGDATINSSTGTVTLSGIVQSGSYTARYTHTDGTPTDRTVPVIYVPTAPGGVVSAKTGRASTTGGTAGGGGWETILTLVLTGAPAGRVSLGGAEALSFLFLNSASGTADYEARLQVNGATLTSVGTQNVVSGGVLNFTSWADLFAGSYAVTAGTLTFTVQMRLTSGAGTIDTTNTALEATVIAS